MQTIHLGDTCDKCKTSLFGDDDISTACRNCGGRFCSQCAEGIRVTLLCPKCNRPPNTAYMPDRNPVKS